MVAYTETRSSRWWPDRELPQYSSVQALAFAIQALHNTFPHYPVSKLEKALGNPRTPYALNRALRNRLSPHLFAAGKRSGNGRRT